MAWAVWLGVPVGLTLLASLVLWWRGRPEPVPGTREAMRRHQDYLDALTVPARGTARTGSSEPVRSDG